MPFTPFHLGPALGLGLPLRKYLHVPTFILASVAIDAEPFLVLLLGLRYPLHGYLHTFLLAITTGVILSCIMFLLESALQPIYRAFLLETGSSSLSLKSFVVAGASGTGLHVLLDSPLYSDIRPFYPLTTNPFYDPTLSLEIYSLCILIGVFGIICYAGVLTWSTYRKTGEKKKFTGWLDSSGFEVVSWLMEISPAKSLFFCFFVSQSLLSERGLGLSLLAFSLSF